MISSFISGLRLKHVIWMTIAVVILMLVNLVLTSVVSTSYKVAVEEVLSSKDIAPTVGQPSSMLLYSTGFESSGKFSCSNFSFLVRGSRGMAYAKLRVFQRDAQSPLKISPVLLGFGSDFSKKCTEEGS